MGYLTNFIVYTMAMVGLMCIAIFVFKNATANGKGSGSKFMKVIDSMSIGPRKSLYIVSAGEEKFLIASDVDKTTLISKLNPQHSYEEKISAVATLENTDYSTKSFAQEMRVNATKESYVDKSSINRSFKENSKKQVGLSDTPYTSVMKNLALKMSTMGMKEE